MKIVESAAVLIQGAAKAPAQRGHLGPMKVKVSEDKVELQREEVLVPAHKSRSLEKSLQTMTRHHGVSSWKHSTPKLWRRE